MNTDTITLYKVVQQFISDKLPPFIICSVTIQRCEKAYKVVAGDASLVSGRRLILTREYETLIAGLSISEELARLQGRVRFELKASQARKHLREAERTVDAYLVELIKGTINGPPNKTDTHA